VKLLDEDEVPEDLNNGESMKANNLIPAKATEMTSYLLTSNSYGNIKV
jgi:hypothetical protein